MQGTISFHPVDVGFFDGPVRSLIAGEKVNPEAFLEAAIRLRTAGLEARRYVGALQAALRRLEPEPVQAAGRLWDKMRQRLDRMGYQPDELAREVAARIDPELHLRGRPFLITEGSAERVADLVDEYRKAPHADAAAALALEQLVRLDPGVARKLEPEEAADSPAHFTYRAELLAELKWLYELGKASRGERDPLGVASSAPPDGGELPWRALRLHARAVPCWVADDVDGLETIRRASGAEAPDFLVPPWRLFGDSAESIGGVRDALHLELQGPRDVGAFVPPEDVPRLLDYLNVQGSGMIQAASRHGEGPACRTLLRKVREVATYAARHGMGYLEGSGIVPPHLEPDAAD